MIHETAPIHESVAGKPLICILCESGYHDQAWEILHLVQCGCPCHKNRDMPIIALATPPEVKTVNWFAGETI